MTMTYYTASPRSTTPRATYINACTFLSPSIPFFAHSYIAPTEEEEVAGGATQLLHKFPAAASRIESKSKSLLVEASSQNKKSRKKKKGSAFLSRVTQSYLISNGGILHIHKPNTYLNTSYVRTYSSWPDFRWVPNVNVM